MVPHCEFHLLLNLNDKNECGFIICIPYNYYFTFFRLADQGHDVVGNEVVDMGCKQVFEEAGSQYTSQPIGTIPGTVYKVNIICICADYLLKQSFVQTGYKQLILYTV